MKWANARYGEIAKEVGVTLDTVKSWFRVNGFLREAYKIYSNDQETENKLKDKQAQINTLNGNKPQLMATNPINSTVFSVFNKLPKKEQDEVMKRFNELMNGGK